MNAFLISKVCRLNYVRFGPNHIFVGPEKVLLQNKKMQTDETAKRTGGLNYPIPLTRGLNNRVPTEITKEVLFSMSPTSLVYIGRH